MLYVNFIKITLQRTETEVRNGGNTAAKRAGHRVHPSCPRYGPAEGNGTCPAGNREYAPGSLWRNRCPQLLVLRIPPPGQSSPGPGRCDRPMGGTGCVAPGGRSSGRAPGHGSSCPLGSPFACGTPTFWPGSAGTGTRQRSGSGRKPTAVSALSGKRKAKLTLPCSTPGERPGRSGPQPGRRRVPF